MVEVLARLSRAEYYKELVGNPDALFVLSGGARIRKNKAGEVIGYTPTSYAYSDHAGVLGGKARNIAAAELAPFLPEQTLIYVDSLTSPATQIYDEFGDSVGTPKDIWWVMRRDLLVRGVSRRRIKTERISFTTHTELIEMVKLAERNGWNDIDILSNEYHEERILAFLSVLDHFGLEDAQFQFAYRNFRERGVNVRFVPAEPVLEHIDERFALIVSEARQSPQWIKRLESERRGTEKLLTDPANYGK